MGFVHTSYVWGDKGRRFHVKLARKAVQRCTELDTVDALEPLSQEES